MRNSESQILLRLCNGSHCIESSSGIKVENKTQIINGPLKGFEGIIRNVDRDKRQTWIGIEFIGAIRLLSVTLEIEEKIQVEYI